jgi:hypothetical protein
VCKAQADCPEEHRQQSEHSPGVVDDLEDLGRIVIAPEHINRDSGELTPGAFPIRDLKHRGLSLIRLVHATQEEIETRAAELASRRHERSVEGLGTSIAWEIRSLRDEEHRQALCVLDDGEEAFPSHAKAIRSADQSEPSLRKLRGELINFFVPVVSIGDAFS